MNGSQGCRRSTARACGVDLPKWPWSANLRETGHGRSTPWRTKRTRRQKDPGHRETRPGRPLWDLSERTWQSPRACSSHRRPRKSCLLACGCAPGRQWQRARASWPGRRHQGRWRPRAGPRRRGSWRRIRLWRQPWRRASLRLDRTSTGVERRDGRQGQGRRRRVRRLARRTVSRLGGGSREQTPTAPVARTSTNDAVGECLRVLLPRSYGTNDGTRL